MFKDYWQSRCLLMLALLPFLSCHLAKQSATNNMPRGCSIITENSTWTSCDCFLRDLSCRVIGTNSTFSIRFFGGTDVEITCFHLDSLDYRLLPNLISSEYSTVHIIHCPLPPGQPIQRIASKLGLTDVHALEYNGGGVLQRVHFEGLQNLSQLSMNLNDTSNLPKDLFAELRNLKDLNVDGNNLINLTKAAFEEVPSARELDLSPNGFANFLPGVMSSFPHLEVLTLTENQIRSLPDGMFATNKNLLLFQLYEHRMQLRRLPGRLLGNLPKLVVVRLSCGLDTIPEDLFATSNGIQEIALTENNLTELPLQLFADQAHLRFLDLSRNQLMSLPDEIFRNTKKLRVLKLSHNRLVTLTNRLFFDLLSLKEINVDNNELLAIHWEAFANNRKLIHIDMANNQITDSTFHLEVIKPAHLTYFSAQATINLKNNSIRTISALSMIRNFREIDLSYNEITTIEIEDVKDNPFLNRRLYLSNNLIEKVYYRDPSADCVSTFTLDLSSNPINCDCALLPFVQFLKSQRGGKCVDFVEDTVNKFQCSNPPNLESRTVTELSPQEVLCPLEGESFSVEFCPENCSCWVRATVGIAIVNCSNTDHTEMPILPKLTSRTVPNVHGTELHIENNRLTQLPNANTPGYMHVVELHASNNSLTEVLAINLPKNLTLLDLSHNRIQHLHDTTLSVLNGSRITVALSGNPWICDCAARGLLRFVLLNREHIRDIEQMECVDGQKFQDLHPNMICSANQNPVIFTGVVIGVVGLCAGVIGVWYYMYQQEIKVWLYARGMCFWLVTEEDLDKDKQYDAFISYSHKNEDFIVNDLLPQLETGPTPFKVCLHSRDWVVGEFIPDQILRSVAESRRTIIVLSPNFLESIWARMEFRTAHSAALKEGRARVIVILYGDVGNIGSLDPDLKAYLQMNTYVKWGDPWFWEKLRYAMPHPPKNVSGPGCGPRDFKR